MKPIPFVMILVAAIGLSACGGGQGAKSDVTPEANVEVVAKPQKIKVTTSQILGQTGPWLLTQLGKPNFSRQEKSAHIWQYKNRDCVLNVFLYHESDALKVLHFDARNNDGSNTDRAVCLSKLQD